MLTIGDPFPVFNAQACVGNDKNGFTEISNGTYKGKWVLYFFYPMDFTVVCFSELVEFGKKLKDFADRNCVLVAGSTDNAYCHQAWRTSHADLKDLPYPLIAAQKLAADLGILDRNLFVCLRGTFLVDPDGIIRWAAAYPLGIGRSVAEALRVLDAVQCGEFCPCNWVKGEPTLKA